MCIRDRPKPAPSKSPLDETLVYPEKGPGGEPKPAVVRVRRTPEPRGGTGRETATIYMGGRPVATTPTLPAPEGFPRDVSELPVEKSWQAQREFELRHSGEIEEIVRGAREELESRGAVGISEENIRRAILTGTEQRVASVPLTPEEREELEARTVERIRELVGAQLGTEITVETARALYAGKRVRVGDTEVWLEKIPELPETKGALPPRRRVRPPACLLYTSPSPRD